MRRILLFFALVLALLLSGCRPSTQPLSLQDAAPQSGLRVQWLNDVIRKPVVFSEYSAKDYYSGREQIIFFASGTVTDVKLLELEYEDIAKDGTILFHQKTVCSFESVSEIRPLVVGVPFYGTIPNFGIAYTDNHGNDHRFCLSISGKDGTLLLEPF